ncbi:Na+/H+ antiporter NhaC [Halomonas binhaiensis]|uniref:Na+/H+ antiporter NhaC n=1 Tax=Halomonas binhaiensis TaxID=2562282 RepID=A0A5C1NGL4_9GAMM|nr:Na+/H+ antiporter NhaC [Halomonas binhaiensis]QEM81793.1 Na+/H+ antiporter NhaC [Halomonas binhaiensis]
MPAQQQLQPGFVPSLLLVTAIAVAITYGIVISGLHTELVLISCGAVATLFTILHGGTWQSVMDIMGHKIKTALTAILVLYSIGMIIGTWMISGTIPYFIYHGLELVDPRYLYVMAFFGTAIVSTFTGTSWGSAGTLGVAIMGIATAMDVNLAITAGAVLSGAYFGDKLSPLSDTTIMASMVVGVDLYRHIRHLMFTSLPAAVLAAAVYLLLGLNMGDSTATPAAIAEGAEQIRSLFDLNLWLMLPVVIVLTGSIRKKPTLVVLFLATLCAIVLALIVQQAPLSAVASAAVSGFNVELLSMIHPEIDVDSLLPALLTLLNRGGLYSMHGAVLFVFCAFFFASALEASGVLQVVLNRTLAYVRSATGTILASLAAGMAIILATGNSYVTFFLTRELFAEQYRKRGLHPLNLSRSLEDGGMIPEPLAPWTVSAVYMAATLGVATIEYAPWALFNYLGLLFSIVLAVAGPWTGWFGVRRIAVEGDVTENGVGEQVAEPIAR